MDTFFDEEDIGKPITKSIWAKQIKNCYLYTIKNVDKDATLSLSLEIKEDFDNEDFIPVIHMAYPDSTTKRLIWLDYYGTYQEAKEIGQLLVERIAEKLPVKTIISSFETE